MGMTKVLGLVAVLEGATGLVLIIHPSLVAQWLFGDGVSGAGMALSRVAGIALLALGVACWPTREAGSGIAPAFRAMLTYSLLVTIYLVYLGGVVHLAGRCYGRQWRRTSCLRSCWSRHGARSGSPRPDQHSDARGAPSPSTSSWPSPSWRRASAQRVRELLILGSCAPLTLVANCPASTEQADFP